MTKLQITLQSENTTHPIPEEAQFQLWVDAALTDQDSSCSELTIRLVDKSEMSELNSKYRHKHGPTNVLSFNYDDEILLGDIVICPEVLVQEAKQQQKTTESHWAHLVVHGLLHLLGYDHIKEEDAEKMETLEIAILEKLNYPNPYILNQE